MINHENKTEFQSIVLDQPESVLNQDGKTVVAIGNFDGCHLGHQRLFAEAVSLADKISQKQRSKIVPTVLSFVPGTHFPQKKNNIWPIFSKTQKYSAFAEFGIQRVYFQTFDKSFSQLNAAEFVNEFLQKKLNCVGVVVGYDFRFGVDRSGDVATLDELCVKAGITLSVVDKVVVNGVTVSSTIIREMLVENGDVVGAESLLGRPFLIEGQVQPGQQIGRELGFPTANINPEYQLTVKNGVYFGWSKVLAVDQNPRLFPDDESGLLPAVLNVGHRPTVQKDNLGQKAGESKPSFEIHLIGQNYEADAFYGKKMAFFFKGRLRDEKRFAGLDQLTAAIKNDIKVALARLNQL